MVVPSSDNQPHSRWRHVIETIAYQNYSNYHLVFIDDASLDDTFQLTAGLVRELGLDNKTTLLRNKDKKYATYNIKEGVQKCGQRDVVVLVDGDDELVSRQVFKLVSAAYQA